MKALHVITGLGTGGAETQLRSYLKHTRHDADVVCLYNPGAVAVELRADGVQVMDLGMRNNRDVSAIRRLVAIMRTGAYDVVHTHLYRACLYGRLAARLASVSRIVATEHSIQNGQVEGRVATASIRALYRASEALGDVTIAVSRAVQEELRAWGVPDRRIVLIPNGMDLSAMTFCAADRATTRADLGLSMDDEVIGSLGRLHAGKRVDVLLRSVAPLLLQGRYLLIVGDGPERSGLEQQARALGVADRVLFAGERPAAPFLAAMDVLASSSPYETFGLAVLEALANGLPVAYTRCPALEDLPERVPTAVHVDGNEAELRAAVLRLLGTAQTTYRVCPAPLSSLSMPAVAAAVDAVYETERGAGPSRPSVGCLA